MALRPGNWPRCRPGSMGRKREKALRWMIYLINLSSFLTIADFLTISADFIATLRLISFFNPNHTSLRNAIHSAQTRNKLRSRGMLLFRDKVQSVLKEMFNFERSVSFPHTIVMVL